MHTRAEIGERIWPPHGRSRMSPGSCAPHHERYDGRGYPICWRARRYPSARGIISVCAAFVAIMKHRPFSDAITVTEALAEVDRNAGSQFDPRVARVFCELLRRANV